MADIMQTVTRVLSGAGYRTGDANPGRVVSEISEPVIAVNLEQLDTEQLTMVLRATVVSPVALGARACEEEAVKVCRILQEIGAQCVVKPCQLNAKTEVFCVPVMLTFQGKVWDTDWQAEDACTVKFGSVNLHTIVSFSAWRETSDTETALQAAIWKFRVEERMDGIQSEIEPAEPFTMTVSFEKRQEVYGTCALTAQKRVIADGHLIQIREGTAKTRTVTV